MANSDNSQNIRPADICPADPEYQAEATVTAWVEREAQPPKILAEAVQRYRDIVVYMDDPNTSVQDANQALVAASSLFDRLKAAAAQQAQIHNQVQAQIRRRQRRDAERRQREYDALPWTEKCNLAIAQWKAGVRV